MSIRTARHRLSSRRRRPAHRAARHALGLSAVQARRRLRDKFPEPQAQAMARLAGPPASLRRSGDGLLQARQEHAEGFRGVALVRAHRKQPFFFAGIWRPWIGALRNNLASTSSASINSRMDRCCFRLVLPVELWAYADFYVIAAPKQRHDRPPSAITWSQLD